MTPDEFDAGMAVLLATWPKEASSPATLEVYEEVVKHLPGDVWRAAALRCVATCTFFPKPVELLTAAAELTTTPARTGAEAWGDVKRAIAENGIYHPPHGAQHGDFRNDKWQFSDPLINQLVGVGRAFPWSELCMSENEMSDRARFIDAYEKLQHREREQARLTPDLLAFQAQHRPALPAPTRQREAARLLAAVTTGLGRDGAKGA